MRCRAIWTSRHRCPRAAAARCAVVASADRRRRTPATAHRRTDATRRPRRARAPPSPIPRCSATMIAIGGWVVAYDGAGPGFLADLRVAVATWRAHPMLPLVTVGLTALTSVNEATGSDSPAIPGLLLP